MKRITLAGLLAALLLLTTGLGAALALPVNNPGAEFFTLDCDDGESYDIVVTPGNPGHILDTNSKLIPHRFTIALIVDGEELFSESEGVGQGEKRGLKDRLLTCTLEFHPDEQEIQEIEAELGLDLSGSDVIVQLSVEVMKTPAGPR